MSSDEIQPKDRTVLDLLARVLAPGEHVRVKGPWPTRYLTGPGSSPARVVKHEESLVYQIEFLEGPWAGELAFYSSFDLEPLLPDSGLSCSDHESGSPCHD